MPTPAHVKAHATGRLAETLFKALSSRVAERWKFVSFRGPNKAEWRGIADVIAIRNDTSQPEGDLLKRGDLFDLILIQVKGGSARMPPEEDRRRLRAVQRLYRARAVVLFEWQRGKHSNFYVLNKKLEWSERTNAIFADKIAEGNIALATGQPGVVSAPTEVGTSKVEDKKALLSEITTVEPHQIEGCRFWFSTEAVDSFYDE
jgi:hypothetical protein